MALPLTSTNNLCGTVCADFTFVRPPADGSTPFIDPALPEGQDISGKETHHISITDIRGHEHAYQLDTDAFQPMQNVSSETKYETFDSEDEIKRVYYPEVEKLLLGCIPGAHRVVVLGHGVRKQDKDGHRQPILFVHCDHSESVAEELAGKHRSPDMAAGLQDRVRIFSIWRPLNSVVQSMPLAFASSASLDKTDLFPVELRYPGGVEWFTGLKYNPHQRWFYWSGMKPDERLLLKCTDSALVVGKQAPHSAFSDPRTPPEAKLRESIEVRALVYG